MTSPTVPDRRLDGNALAGPLLELFAVDLSGLQLLVVPVPEPAAGAGEPS